MAQKKKKFFNFFAKKQAKHTFSPILWTSVFLVILTIAFLSFLILKIWKTDSIVDFLPQETIGFVECDLLAKNSSFDFDKIKLSLELYLNTDLDQIESWIGRSNALAILKDNKKIQPVLFLNTRNQELTKEFLQTLGFKDEKFSTDFYRNFPIYRYEQSRSEVFTFIKDYVAIAYSEEILKKLIDANLNLIPKLNQDFDFQKVARHLPQYSDAFFYLDLQKFQNTKWGQFEYGYLFEIFHKWGGAFSEKDGSIKFNTFTIIDKKLLPSPDQFAKRPKFQKNLSTLIPDYNLIAYFGGVNLEEFFKDHFSLLEQYNPPLNVILEGLINAKIDEFLGEEIYFQKDLLPFLESEYAFFIFHDQDQNLQASAIFEISQPLKIKENMAKIMKNFETKSAYFIPKLKTRTLPDGTVTRELVADYAQVKKEEETYQGVDIQGISLEEHPYGLYVAMTDNEIILSSDLAGIKRILDQKNNDNQSLVDNQIYKKARSQILILGDEITYLNFEKLRELVELDIPFLQEEEWESGLWTLKIFNDGMSLEGVILK